MSLCSELIIENEISLCRLGSKFRVVLPGVIPIEETIFKVRTMNKMLKIKNILGFIF